MRSSAPARVGGWGSTVGVVAFAARAGQGSFGGIVTESGSVVYVVDDDPSVREALESLLRSVGLAVTTFASASEFSARERCSAPACLVLDLNLPEGSGLDLQQELAKQDPMPIVFITGHGDVPSSVRAMKAGAVEFLP